MIDILLKGGTVISEDTEELLSVGIHSGKIVGLYQLGEEPESKRVIDCASKLIIPGIIDPHTHFGIYHSHVEDFKRDTPAAAIGGVTTIVNYYRHNSTYLDTIPKWIELAEQNSLIDFALSLGMVSQSQFQEFPKVVKELGVTSWKYYSQYKGRVGSVLGIEDPLPLDDYTFVETLKAIQKTGQDVRLCIHCENQDLARPLTNEIKEMGGTTLTDLEKGSPGYFETADMIRFMYLTSIIGGHIYIVHLSAKESVDALKNLTWLLEKTGTIVETTPHYLTLTTNNPHKELAKVGPPIRYEEDNEALWDGLRLGIISVLGSDHVPSMLKVRQETGSDIWATKYGFAGVGLMLPLIISEGYHKRNLSLRTLIGSMTWNPAKAFGLYPKKGAIKPGADADVVVLDINKEETINEQHPAVGVDHTPYSGITLKGWPQYTISRGEVIAADGRVEGQLGRGKYLFRS